MHIFLKKWLTRSPCDWHDRQYLYDSVWWPVKYDEHLLHNYNYEYDYDYDFDYNYNQLWQVVDYMDRYEVLSMEYIIKLATLTYDTT